MAINLAEKFSPLVDERFEVESKSALIVNSDYDFVGAKTIKIYSVGTSQMNDYGRNAEGTSRYGTVNDLSTELQEVSMEKDRSFTYAIDKMDEDETLQALNAGSSLARQLREVVIPEVDKYTYAKVSANAGTSKTETITKENAYTSILTANETQDELKVPEQGRILVATPKFINLLKQDKNATLDTDIAQEMKLKGVIAEMDGVSIQKVVASLLPENTNFILVHPIATTRAIKLAEYKINNDPQGISGTLIEGRIYYTAFVRNNKKSAIYVSKSA